MIFSQLLNFIDFIPVKAFSTCLFLLSLSFNFVIAILAFNLDKTIINNTFNKIKAHDIIPIQPI